MRRREFITGLGAAATPVLWPVAGRAQQPAKSVIGYLHVGTLETTRDVVAAVRLGLSDIGYVEGQNLAVEYRWADYHLERLPGLAADLVRRQVSAIVSVQSTAGVLAAKAATNSIPIVFAVGSDPVEAHLVASLNRPGGNLTGVANLTVAVMAKRLELLHEFAPSARSVAFLVNPTNPVYADTETSELQAAARVLGMRLIIFTASMPSEFESIFTALVREAAGLVVGGDPLFSTHSDQIVALATRHRVPAIYDRRKFTVAGGLMSYGTDYANGWRQVGVYAGRILKGEKPADLPVQQVTKVELVINLKTAKALGLTFPLTFLSRADEVIE
jgi:putative tryptophan/tyrosine transport system substrate-binding protein